MFCCHILFLDDVQYVTNCSTGIFKNRLKMAWQKAKIVRNRLRLAQRGEISQQLKEIKVKGSLSGYLNTFLSCCYSATIFCSDSSKAQIEFFPVTHAWLMHIPSVTTCYTGFGFEHVSQILDWWCEACHKEAYIGGSTEKFLSHCILLSCTLIF